MAAKEILYSTQARAQIGRGLDALANVVKVTLGPKGRNVVLDRAWGAPLITKDGVTVAKEIEVENRFANLGAQMVKEVASKTADVTGDGTTTATVLAQVIFAEGTKLVTAGIDPMEIKRGIDAAVQVVVATLKEHSKPIKEHSEIEQVARISANGDEEIGRLIAEAMEKVGREGVVTIEEAKSMDTTLEFAQGMQLDRGYISPYFVTDFERMETIFTDALVLIVEKKVSSMQDLLPLLEEVSAASQPLLIVAEDVDGEALSTLVVNKLRGTLNVCAVKGPGFGDRRKAFLEDLGILCGTRAVTEDLGIELSKLTIKDLGRVKTVTIDKDTTTFVEGGGTPEAILARTNQLRAQLEDTTSDYDREKLQERIAKLAGGVAVINVGAFSETEMKEKKERVDDALHATRAAISEGVVVGGGVALLRTLPALEALVLVGDQQYGANVIRRAMEQPLRQIAHNGGVEGAVVVSKVREATGPFGYNAASGEYEDLVAAGIIDPTKVVRVALQNAASVASMMLTTETLIAEWTDDGRSSKGARA